MSDIFDEISASPQASRDIFDDVEDTNIATIRQADTPYAAIRMDELERYKTGLPVLESLKRGMETVDYEGQLGILNALGPKDKFEQKILQKMDSDPKGAWNLLRAKRAIEKSQQIYDYRTRVENAPEAGFATEFGKGWERSSKSMVGGVVDVLGGSPENVFSIAAQHPSLEISPKATLGGKAGRMLGETGPGLTAGVAASLATGGAGAPVTIQAIASSIPIAAQVFNDTKQQALSRGLEENEATKWAAVNAIGQSIIEVASGGGAKYTGGFKGFAKGLLKNAIKEGLLEELPQQMIDILVRMQLGEEFTLSQIAKELAGSAAAGTVLGGAMEGIGKGIGSFTTPSTQIPPVSIPVETPISPSAPVTTTEAVPTTAPITVSPEAPAIPVATTEAVAPVAAAEKPLAQPETSQPPAEIPSKPTGKLTKEERAYLKEKGYSAADLKTTPPEDARMLIEQLREMESKPAELPTPPPAAAPSEIPAVPAESVQTTSARKADIARDRKAMDLDAIASPEQESWKINLKNARAAGIPERALRLSQEILTSPRALSADETAGMVIKATELKDEHAALMDRLGKASDPADIKTFSGEAARIEAEFDSLTQALRKSGTEKGRALAAQKLTLDQDMNLISVLNRAKSAKGAALTDAERAKFTALTEELDAATKRAEAAEAKMKELEAKRMVREGTAKKYARMNNADKDVELNALVNKTRTLLEAGCYS